MHQGPSQRSLTLSLVALLAVGCGGRGKTEAATVELAPLGDTNVRGTVEMSTTREGRVKIEAKVTGLTPGPHGFHVHEVGDCSAPDGSTAGEHFNPGHTAHGGPGGPGPHHAGDLGNLVADGEGRANLVLETDAFTLDAGERSVLGRALVVHAGADDLHSDPAGNSGARLACGVIRAKGR